MPRIAIFNMALGFAVLFLAAAAGAFLATTVEDAFTLDRQLLSTWQFQLQRSAHAHTNLFGILHILFGLSIPYSSLKLGWVKLQTIGLSAGTSSMGILLLVKSVQIPPANWLPINVVMGIGLSAALATLASHAFGLAAKVSR